MIFENQSSKSMEDRQEQRNEGQIIPRRRVRSSPLNLHGERHQMPTLPQDVIPIFFGDGIMDPENHLDRLLTICDIYLIEHDGETLCPNISWYNL